MQNQKVEKQNITLSVPKDLLKKAKILAIQQDKSLSGMLTEMLTTLVEADERHEESKKRSKELMAKAKADAPRGGIRWTRESLYDR